MHGTKACDSVCTDIYREANSHILDCCSVIFILLSIKVPVVGK